MTESASSRDLLGPAISAARKALQRLDDKDVPAALRKIAGYSGGRLPPPLAGKLVRALDEDRWLRDKALEEWSVPDPEEDRPDLVASALFLERPEGWWVELGGLSASKGEGRAAAEMEQLRRRLEKAEKARDDLKRREREAKEASRRAEVEARRVRDRLRKELEKQRRDETAAADAARDAWDLVEQSRQDAEVAAGEAQREAAGLREALRRTRKDRARLERKLTGADGGATARLAPVELARGLDATAAMARPAEPEAPVAAPVQTGEWGLPAGVRPDDAAAVDWLAGQSSPFTLLIDGYNVSYQFAGDEFATARARQVLNQELARLSARSTAEARIVVVYDSTQAAEREVAAPARGVEVVFAAGDRIADDEIVDLAATIEGRVAVVSSDREVREDAGALGAVTIWGEALVAWLRTAQ